MRSDEKLESLRFISQTQREAAKNRVVTEWKVVFTALTFFVLCAAAKCRPGFSVHASLTGLAWILFPVLAALTSAYLTVVHASNRRNKKIAHAAERAVEAILNGEDPEIELHTPSERWWTWSRWSGDGKGGRWTWLWQTIMLLVFAVASASVLSRAESGDVRQEVKAALKDEAVRAAIDGLVEAKLRGISGVHAGDAAEDGAKELDAQLLERARKLVKGGETLTVQTGGTVGVVSADLVFCSESVGPERRAAFPNVCVVRTGEIKAHPHRLAAPQGTRAMAAWWSPTVWTGSAGWLRSISVSLKKGQEEGEADEAMVLLGPTTGTGVCALKVYLLFCGESR